MRLTLDVSLAGCDAIEAQVVFFGAAAAAADALSFFSSPLAAMAL